MKIKTKVLLNVFAFLMLGNFMSYGQAYVSYHIKNHGKTMHKTSPLRVSYKDGVAVLHSDNEEAEQFIDYHKKAVFKTLQYQGKAYTNKTPFDSLQPVELLKDRDTILGFPVRKAHMTLFSNSIDIWYTDELSLKGSPSLSVAPQLGLVLKMVRNGDYQIVAEEIHQDQLPDSLDTLPTIGKLVDEATLRRKQIQSRYKTISIFKEQQINFGDSIVNPRNRQIDQVYRFSKGTVIAKKVHLPEDFKGNIFATLTQHSNGDAYDRTGSVFVIPMKDSISFLDALENGIEELPFIKDEAGNSYQGYTKTENYSPTVELIRFFTPFGVRAFNSKREIKGYTWADSVIYKQEVTALKPYLKGEVWIGVYIGNYDQNGHTVSLDLNYYPTEEKKEERFVQPLFNTLNIMEMADQNYARLFRTDSLTFKAYVPENIGNLRMRYISTGHGGWGGGDEFNPKENTILIDGEEVFVYTPWRTDCATYRLKNPSSGNFPNGLSSSDLSRSGWCPGTITNPVYVPLPDLKSGWHTFTIAIPQGTPEGNSFSYWNVSGILTGTYR